MRAPHPFVSVVILITLISTQSFSQENITITEPIIQLKSNNLAVYYDIVNSEPGDEFSVWMDITDSAGNYIMPEAIAGDIGENIEGGRRKKVVWNLSKDSVYMDAVIIIQLHAELTKKAEPEVVYIQQPGVVSGQVADVPKQKKYIGKTKGVLLLKSAVFPGWGLTELKNKPHWIKGVVGYSLVGATIFFADGISGAAEDYRDAMTIDDRDQMYEIFQKESSRYNACLAATISVWTIDLVWMAFTKSKRKELIDAQGFSVQPGYEPYHKAPMLTFNYRF